MVNLNTTAAAELGKTHVQVSKRLEPKMHAKHTYLRDFTSRNTHICGILHVSKLKYMKMLETAGIVGGAIKRNEEKILISAATRVLLTFAYVSCLVSDRSKIQEVLGQTGAYCTRNLKICVFWGP